MMNIEVTPTTLRKTELPHKFDEIKISLASPEQILSWSYGEIKKPETINYRTFKPERDGLFCARILGPVKDYECLCGKYKKMKYRGVTCEKCGVEVTLQSVRRERMGHIVLAAPVAHIWFLKSLPSRIGGMLDIPLKNLESILYFEKYVVIEEGLSEFSRGQLLSEEELNQARDDYGEGSFKAGIGAEAIREMLSQINLKEETVQIREDLLNTNSKSKKDKLKKQLKLYESFLHSGNRPEWMIMTLIPVIPPELRPLVPLDGGRFATSDLNDLYRRVINRNNRLKRLLELQSPDIIIRNEKRMLQEAVDALFDNGRRGRTITGNNKRPLKSLSDMLKGKQGRFRQNLLGKRVDFSGRSVIVTGPELKLHQCGLPKKMALELFKPFIYSKLEKLGKSSTVKAAKKIVEQEENEVWDILEEVIREHPVLLNRAPTLHRLGIQAFEPVLVEGKAIQLHPLVCSAFNADFDGDQMAVHVPLSVEAQLEARVLMMSTNNVLSPANGAPIIVPSQDMVLGLYYLSMERWGMLGETRGQNQSKNGSLKNGEGASQDFEGEKADFGSRFKVFGSIQEVEHALLAGKLHLHAKIKARIKQAKSMDDIDGGSDYEYKIFDTTPGRVLIGSLLPLNVNTPFSLVNRLLRKKEVQEVIDTVYRYCGQKESIIFCDQIMALGFREACRSGISFGKDDMLIPTDKQELVSETRKKVEEFEEQYQEGGITEKERYNRVIEAWTDCSNNVLESMMEGISSVDSVNKKYQSDYNSIFMMAHAGARGSEAQIKQLAGMRGLMAKPSGEIIETPIISNFKEGLTVQEYFNSTHGARKGLADTALKTSNSGYLTRKLVDVAQDCIVRQEDCGTNNAITVRPAMRDGIVLASLSERVLGRVTAEDVLNPETEEVIIPKGEFIDEIAADRIEKAHIQSVRVRSPLTCETKIGICAKCYGRDLARGEPVNMGEAVGIIAAQSIGEPGTQLTMRMFHVGGIAQQGEQQSSTAQYSGVVELSDVKTISTITDEEIVIGTNGVLYLRDSSNRSIRYKLEKGARLLVKDSNEVNTGEIMFIWDPHSVQIISETGGQVKFQNLISGVSYREETDAATGMSQKIVVDSSSNKNPGTVISGTEMVILPVDKKADPKIATRISLCASLANYLMGEMPRIYPRNRQGIDFRHVEILSRVYCNYNDANSAEHLLLPVESKINLVGDDSKITMHDCGTKRSVSSKILMTSREDTTSLADLYIGRVVAEDVVNPTTGDIIVNANQVISNEAAREIEAANIEEFRIRSPLTCESHTGVCSNCYGELPGETGILPNIDRNLGKLALDEIGEIANQIAIRMNNSKKMHQQSIMVPHAGRVSLSDKKQTRLYEFPKVRKDPESILVCEPGLTVEISENRKYVYSVPQDARMLMKDDTTVKEGELLFIPSEEKYSNEYLAKNDGRITLSEFNSVTLMDAGSRKKSQIVTAKNAILRLDVDGLRPITRKIPLGAELFVNDGDEVAEGQVIFKSCASRLLKSANYSGRISILKSKSVKADKRKTKSTPESEPIEKTELILEYLHKTPHQIPLGADLKVADEDFVREDQVLYDWSPKIREVRPPIGGIVTFLEPQKLVKSSGKDGNLYVSFGRSALVEVSSGSKKHQVQIPRGAKILVNDGDKIRKTNPLWEWDPCLAEMMHSGCVHRIDHKAQDIKARVDFLTITFNRSIEYPLSGGAVLSVGDGDLINQGDVIARVPRESTKTSDITGGLPKVAELFDARIKEPAEIASIDGTVRIDGNYKKKRKVTIVDAEDSLNEIEYLIPSNEQILVQDGDKVRKGDNITEGTPSPQNILDVLGVEALADHLIEEVQQVYRQQGVKIGDKHIEVILRQMLQKVQVIDPGETTLIEGEQLDKDEFEQIKVQAIQDCKRVPTSKPILLGITKAALQTKSFISAASFQETTRVLTTAAIEGKTDKLNGLKENVIVGRLIPAGTGSAANELRQIARERDQELIKEREALMEEQERLESNDILAIENFSESELPNPQTTFADEEENLEDHIEE